MNRLDEIERLLAELDTARHRMTTYVVFDRNAGIKTVCGEDVVREKINRRAEEHLRCLLTIARAAERVSAAAAELQRIESAHMTPNELSDAWENAYTELYSANKAYRQALAGE